MMSQFSDYKDINKLELENLKTLLSERSINNENCKYSPRRSKAMTEQEILTENSEYLSSLLHSASASIRERKWTSPVTISLCQERTPHKVNTSKSAFEKGTEAKIPR